MTEHHPRKQLEQLMQWARDFRISRLVTTAVETGILERFDNGPSTVDEIITADDDREGLLRFVHALTALGLLIKNGEETFEPSKLTREFLLPGATYDLRPILTLFHRNYEMWEHLPDILEAGHDVEHEVFGDVEFGREFMLAMETRAHFAKQDVAEAVTDLLVDGDRLIDLGGGTGVFTREILDQSPGTTAVLADLDHVVETAREFSKDSSVFDRLSFQTLDFFDDESYGEHYDVALLFSICHMFGPDKNRTLLNHTADALKPGGKLVVRDYVLKNDGVGPLESNLFDLHMLLATDTGQNYTLDEYRSLFNDAGLKFERKLSVEGHDELIVATKPDD